MSGQNFMRSEYTLRAPRRYGPRRTRDHAEAGAVRFRRVPYTCAQTANRMPARRTISARVAWALKCPLTMTAGITEKLVSPRTTAGRRQHVHVKSERPAGRGDEREAQPYPVRPKALAQRNKQQHARHGRTQRVARQQVCGRNDAQIAVRHTVRPGAMHGSNNHIIDITTAARPASSPRSGSSANTAQGARAASDLGAVSSIACVSTSSVPSSSRARCFAAAGSRPASDSRSVRSIRCSRNSLT